MPKFWTNSHWVTLGDGIFPVGSKQIITPNGTSTVPGLKIGTSSSQQGFWKKTDTTIGVILAGAEQWRFTDVTFDGISGGTASLKSITASDTSPVFTFTDDTDTGGGHAGADINSQIAGAIEAIRMTEAASLITVDVGTKFKITPEGGIAIKLTNRSGGALTKGRVVKTDAANDDSFTVTGVDDQDPIGVVYNTSIADDAEGFIVVGGIADVAADDNTAATHGNWVEASESGYADMTGASPGAVVQHFRELGHCIESVAATGGGTHILARCVLQFN